jgi:hypothetical protein
MIAATRGLGGTIALRAETWKKRFVDPVRIAGWRRWTAKHDERRSNMTWSKFITAGAFAMTAICGAASAQGLPEGRIYSFHSSPQHGCPSLDWHVVANGDSLSGMISWNNMQHMARASGTLNIQSRTFQMTAKEVGGQNRTATITGTVRQDGWLVAQISGPGVQCTGVTVQWQAPPPPNG